MPRENTKFGFGATGVILGALCVVFIWAVEVYGPGSYTTAGSGILYTDGTVTMEVARPLLPGITRAAFYTCLVSTLFGIVSIVRREALSVSLGAIAFGIAPILMYTLGIIFSFVLYAGLVVLITGIELHRFYLQREDLDSTIITESL